MREWGPALALLGERKLMFLFYGARAWNHREVCFLLRRNRKSARSLDDGDGVSCAYVLYLHINELQIGEFPSQDVLEEFLE